MPSRTLTALAACSPAPGRLDVFLGARDGGVWQRTFDGLWSPWLPLDRPWPSPGAPGADWLAVTPSGPGRIELFALGDGGELWHRSFADGDWAEWTSQGPVTSRLAPGGFTAVSTGPDALHVYTAAGDRGTEIAHWRPGTRCAPVRPGLPACGQLGAVPIGPGEFDLFVSGAPERHLLRGHFTDDRPVVWDDLGSPPAGGPSFPRFAATGHDLFAVGRQGLWHRRLGLDGPADWEDLGGDLTTDGTAPALLAAASPGGGRTDVFAVWAGTAVTHRWFDGASWSDWQLLDVRDDPPGVYHALRPQDLVTLTVRSTGLRERVRADGVTELVADHPGGRLVVDFPGQHTAETTLGSGSPVQARTAGPSRLSFAADQQPIALTVAGVLTSMGRLPLVTTPESTGPEVSRLELPQRLLLALRPCTHCTHRALPATGAGGATELWHSRITGPGSDGHVSLRPYQALADTSGLATPLAHWVDMIAALGVQHPGQPLVADRLILSAFGAWFSASVDWPELAWVHHAAMGRDYHVQVAKHGALFPFGHRAAYFEVADRRFDQTDPAVAALRTRRFLVVTEPDREYGIGDGGRHERKFPFQRATVEPRQLTELDEPSWVAGHRGFWPTRAGAAVEFTVRAQAGQEVVDLRLPLLFADDTATGAADATALDAEYAQVPRAGGRRDRGRPMTWVGSRIPLAMRSAAEPLAGAVQEVQSMTFGGVGAALSPRGVGFYPQVTRMEVGLPAVRQLLGPTGAVPAAFAADFVNTLPGAPPPDQLLDLLEQKVLDFAAAGPRSGLLAAPEMAVTQVSRELGPVVGAPLPMDPSQLFGPNAKLFGVVPLRTVLSVIRNKPKIVWAQAIGTSAPSATLTWKEQLTNHVGPFYPGTASWVSLEAVSSVVGGRPSVHTKGEITDFSLEIPSRSSKLVTLTFGNVRFTANSGEQLNLKFDLKNAQLEGKLGFVKKLSQYIPQAGPGGPQIDVSATEVKAAYTVAVPTTALMVFTVQNLSLKVGLTLSLTNQPISIEFAFGTRERPFLVTVSGFGGGGYLELGVGAGDPGSGLQRFVGGIEFGASVAMDFVIASAEVHVLGGVVMVKRGDSVDITGYLRIGGSVSVLGLIRVSVELTISLTYYPDTNELSGSAKLVITVDLTFWSTSVTLECHKSFKGPALVADPGQALPESAETDVHGSSVETALGPQGQSFPWQTYCRAFAGE
ncbi:hypothetical protein [Streptomyces sioyaensis]|uniref:hypothetical protein n=1 Tax=Streptomyces sioyaensis TaxID=67364 RepID=UPI0036E1144C